MASKQKLELTWLGKDKEIKIEPRILIEDKEKSNCKNGPDTENSQHKVHFFMLQYKSRNEALIIRFLLNPYGLPMIGATVIAFIELINEKKIKAVWTNLNLTGISNNVEIKAL